MSLWVTHCHKRGWRDQPILRGTHPIHRIPTGYPRLLHNPDRLSTLCGDCPCRLASTVRTVSETPTYDQLRGERIEADMAACEADPPAVDRPGRHRLHDDAIAGSAVPTAWLRPRADLADNQPRFGREKPDGRREIAAAMRRKPEQRGENKA